MIVDFPPLRWFLWRGVCMDIINNYIAVARKLLRLKRIKCFFISADLKIKLGCGVHRPKEKIGLEEGKKKTLPSDYLEKH